MITVNPRVATLDPDLIKNYYKVAPATLGHGLNSAMHPHIEALWKPVKLVGHAVSRKEEKPPLLSRTNG